MENTKLLNALESKFKLYELNKGDVLLESNENYLKVRKDLHLTWYPLI